MLRARHRQVFMQQVRTRSVLEVVTSSNTAAVQVVLPPWPRPTARRLRSFRWARASPSCCLCACSTQGVVTTAAAQAALLRHCGVRLWTRSRRRRWLPVSSTRTTSAARMLPKPLSVSRQAPLFSSEHRQLVKPTCFHVCNCICGSIFILLIWV